MAVKFTKGTEGANIWYSVLAVEYFSMHIKGRVHPNMIKEPMVEFFMLSWPLGLPTLYGPPGSRGSISGHLS